LALAGAVARNGPLGLTATERRTSPGGEEEPRNCGGGGLMSRPNSGEVLEHLLKDGKTTTFRARIHAYGVRTRITFGTTEQGWNRRRAELELEKILQQVERGTWVPPTLAAKEDRRALAMASLGVHIDERFSAFAARWWKSKRLRVQDRTIADYEWRLGYLERFFGRFELGEIDVALVDRFRDELHEQAVTTRAAAVRGRPLIDQRDAQAAGSDSPAGRGLRADRAQPRSHRRTRPAFPAARQAAADVPRDR